MKRNYRGRSPRMVMEMIIKAIYLSKETLSYTELRKVAGNYMSLNYGADTPLSKNTFNKALKKLRENNIVDRDLAKTKRSISIRFTAETRSSFPFIIVPNTYLSRSQLEFKLLTGNRLARNRRRNESDKSYVETYQKILQYFLIRGVWGVTWFILNKGNKDIVPGSVEGMYYSKDVHDDHYYWFFPLTICNCLKGRREK